MEEIFTPINGFEARYEISNIGRLLSINGKYGGRKILPCWIDNVGYYAAYLRNTDNNLRTRIHRLVALHFVPLIEGKLFVNHKDGNKLNNHFTNLEWVTCSENLKHAFATGLIDANGEKSSNAILTNEKVMAIRKEYHTKCRKDIAKDFQISERYIYDIVMGVNWKHLPLEDYSHRKIKVKRVRKSPVV